MKIQTEKQGRNITVKFQGDIDHHSAGEIKEQLDQELELGSAKNLLFDLSDVKFMDSSGIGMMIGRYKLVANKGGKLVVFGMRNELKRIFELSGLQKIINRCNTKEEACSLLREGRV